MVLLVRRPAMLATVLLVLIASLACEKPDASHTTSPSVLSLIGTTTGAVAINAPETAPAPVEPPAGWEFELGNARFSTLENGQHSIQVVTQLVAQAGPGLEVWLSGTEGTVFRWSGGSARPYNGVVCFQLRLEDEDAAVPLTSGEVYRLTMAFRDPAGERVVTARTVTVAGRVPEMDKPLPEPGSEVVRDLLGCPRSVI